MKIEMITKKIADFYEQTKKFGIIPEGFLGIWGEGDTIDDAISEAKKNTGEADIDTCYVMQLRAESIRLTVGSKCKIINEFNTLSKNSLVYSGVLFSEIEEYLENQYNKNESMSFQILNKFQTKSGQPWIYFFQKGADYEVSYENE